MNYKHLHYFWTVLRAGGVVRASEQLHLTPQTLSGQIKLLEQRLGQPLLRKVGRGVEPTDAGRLVMRYADEIFSLGAALQEALDSGRDLRRATVLRVGIADALPKAIAFHVLEPAMALPEPPQLVCHEGGLTSLLGELAVHRLDLVLSDVPAPARLSVKVYTHLLGRTGMAFFAAPQLLKAAGLTARRAQASFPACLAQLPLLLPTRASALRARLDAWLRQQALAPTVAAEFDDSALLKAFGREGQGVFAAPAVLAQEIVQQYQVTLLGHPEDLWEEFYAISVERRISHPAVAAITAAARCKLFAPAALVSRSLE
ncbi:transcriptional activator NhaR [Simplicispira psychrophila]|uniref:transcriptional activator NhaR n=1 Tax=Simplicispira psychrophila TaxID=80882 RepID=UPI000480CBAE|nr:transcriptional activator NhaR [Simplicispira psychrophila]